MAGELRARLEALVAEAARAALSEVGPDLVAVILFGSVARRSPNEEFDIDLLCIASRLPPGRAARQSRADAIERRWQAGRTELPRLSLVLRTAAEVEEGFPLLLDIAREGRPLWGASQATEILEGWRQRLARQGARYIRTGETWHWDLAGDSATPGRWSL